MTLFVLIIGLSVGFLLGYLFAKYIDYRSADLNTNIGTLQNLTNQVLEMKTKFEEIEKSRQKLDFEREKRLKQFFESNKELFKQLQSGFEKSNKEKDKILKLIQENNKEFLEEEKKHNEKLLLEQGKSMEELEKRRDAQLKDMENILNRISQVFSGTKVRGMTGELLLKDVLKNSIKAGVIKTNLKTDNGEVEFAWDLGDGKFIPIDSKFPDLLEMTNEYVLSKDLTARRNLQKQIFNKAKREIERVKKYQNLSNTIDSCILVFPQSVLEICPDIVSLGAEDNVFVCSYTEVFPIAHMLQDKYFKLKEEGDIGKYKLIVQKLLQILDKIRSKTDAIDKALTTIRNANDKIRIEISKGKRDL